MKLEHIIQAGVLLSMGIGAVLWSQSQFASATGTAQTFQQHSIVTQEAFNEQRMQRLTFELEQLRARQRAGHVYSEDMQTEAYLKTELERARAYQEQLRQLKAGIK